ncbi:sensor histidine kinase [Paenibacillus guangzhouensis]|uniref:sensor histidine kinase n=1 Tax=Paenibacillus guangzhouensis TaxID=1473112 RepID=UPI0012674600|nr:sensor histidine kinase [Paenibacillus guangzhouensis]
MRPMIDFYQKHFKQKLFNKILMIYSLITIVSLATLSVFVFTYYSNNQIKKELDANNHVLSSIGSYLDARHAASQQIIQQIYQDGSSTLLDDALSFLRNSFSDYLDERLSQFSDTGIRRRDVFNFLRIQLNTFSDIRTIGLYSSKKNFILLLTKDTQTYYPVNHDLQNVLNQYVITPKSITTVSNITNLTTLETDGNLIIDYNSDGIYRAFQNNWSEMKGYVLVLTPNGNVVFDSSNRYYGAKYPYMSQLNSSSSTQQFEEPSYVNVQTTNRFGYWIVGVIPKREMSDSMVGLRNTLMLVTSLVIVAAMGLTYFTIVNFSRRTRTIVRAMEKLRSGDLSVRITMEKEDELFQIADRFNHMTEDLTRYIDRVYVSEIRQKQAELVAFQAQIKPHFLYNTLEAIRMRALSYQAEDVGEMIYILSTLFRYSVRRDTIVPLENEIEYCSLYLDLFRIRYMQNFSYEIDIEPELMSLRVLKLSIQPIIENYIVHGLVMSRTDNRIWIQAAMEDDVLMITIKDNGSGIAPEKLESIRQKLNTEVTEEAASQSIGLMNTHERIKICFGPTYGIRVESVPGQGTLITMKIPASQGGELYA